MSTLWKRDMRPDKWYLKYDENHPRAAEFLADIKANGANGKIFDGTRVGIYYGYKSTYGYTWCMDTRSYESGGHVLITMDEYFGDVLPDDWCVLRDMSNYEVINNWFISKGLGTPYYTTDYIAVGAFEFVSGPTLPSKGYTPITFEQFKTLVLKETKMKPQTITRAGVKELHYAACSAWKDKVLTASGLKADPFIETITFTDEFVESMYAAASDTQTAVLNKWLKRPVKDKNMIKPGLSHNKVRELMSEMFNVPDVQVLDGLAEGKYAALQHKALILPMGYRFVVHTISDHGTNRDAFTIEKI